MDLRDVKKVDSGSEDVTKSLPDEILAKILCFLPTKRAASTSILSKRWRDLFPLMIRLFSSQLHFYLDDLDLVYPVAQGKKDRQDVHRSFRDFVRKTLSCSDTIRKLSLRCLDGLVCFDLTNQWIRIALERGLVVLDLRLKPNVGPRMAGHYLHASHRLPSTVFANKTLVKLALGVDLGDRRTVYPQVSLPVLKSLFLCGHWFRVEGLCSRMLPGCPKLKELSLRYFCGDFTTDLHERQLVISISHKTLKSLSVHCNSSLDFPCTATLKTPRLVYFDYSGVAPFRFSADNFLSSLAEAKLDVEMKRRYSAPTRAPTDLSMIIECMRNVTNLSLSSTSVEAMYSTCTEVPSFVNLVKLSFESNTKEGWKLLPLLLNKSSKLKTLVLKGLHCVENEEVCIDRAKVKVFEVYGFRGSRGREVTQRDCSLRSTVSSSVEGGT